MNKSGLSRPPGPAAIYFCSRFAVCARSPLTGLWGEAAVGGNFGPVLRQAGYDGIELAGAAAVPRTLPRPADAASLTELPEAAW